MPEVTLSAGTIEYEDTGGSGPVIVFLHGVLMDSWQWRDVVPLLSGDHRCVSPTLPLGAHRLAMQPEADLTLRGQARIVSELLESLDLHDVTLCFNDWAAPQILVADGLCERIGGMVLIACETAGNYPPGLPGRNLALLGRVPGGLSLALRALRIRTLRRTPLTFGWMSKHGIDDDLFERWLSASRRDPGVLRDLAAYVRSTRQSKRDLVAATTQLGGFVKPVTVVWATEDRVMPMREGVALADAFPQGRLVTVEDSYTLAPLDQPRRTAELIREHVAAQGRT